MRQLFEFGVSKLMDIDFSILKSREKNLTAISKIFPFPEFFGRYVKIYAQPVYNFCWNSLWQQVSWLYDTIFSILLTNLRNIFPFRWYLHSLSRIFCVHSTSSPLCSCSCSLFPDKPHKLSFIPLGLVLLATIVAILYV